MIRSRRPAGCRGTGRGAEPASGSGAGRLQSRIDLASADWISINRSADRLPRMSGVFEYTARTAKPSNSALCASIAGFAALILAAIRC